MSSQREGQRELDEATRANAVEKRKVDDELKEGRSSLKKEKGGVQRRLSELDSQCSAVALREKTVAESETTLRKQLASRAEREQKVARKESEVKRGIKRLEEMEEKAVEKMEQEEAQLEVKATRWRRLVAQEQADLDGEKLEVEEERRIVGEERRAMVRFQ